MSYIYIYICKPFLRIPPTRLMRSQAPATGSGPSSGVWRTCLSGNPSITIWLRSFHHALECGWIRKKCGLIGFRDLISMNWLGVINRNHYNTIKYLLGSLRIFPSSISGKDQEYPSLTPDTPSKITMRTRDIIYNQNFHCYVKLLDGIHQRLWWAHGWPWFSPSSINIHHQLVQLHHVASIYQLLNTWETLCLDSRPIQRRIWNDTEEYSLPQLPPFTNANPQPCLE